MLIRNAQSTKRAAASQFQIVILNEVKDLQLLFVFA